MNIVITMAGEGSRFKKVGYTIPKFMIEAKGKTLFEWSMLSLEGLKNENNKYIFITRKEHNAKEFITNICNSKLNISNIAFVEIDKLTDGQATTAILAKDVWIENDEVLIYNIDTFVEPFQMNTSDIKGDGWIPCFYGEGDHWSFVKLGDDGSATEVTEKVRVSDNCSLGSYYFKTTKLYEDAYHNYYGNNLNFKEKYIAPMYNYLVDNGYKVYISVVDKDKIHVLGTPDELNQFIESDYKYINKNEENK